jgi:hypothetical protein
VAHVAVTDIKHNGKEYKGAVLGRKDDMLVELEPGDTLPSEEFSEEELQALVDAGAAKEVKSRKAAAAEKAAEKEEAKK